MVKLLAATAATTLALGATAFAQDSGMQDDAMAGDAMMNMITTEGATFTEDTVTFPSLAIDQDGYIVIHATVDGQPVVPASIGHTAISAGQNEDVAVTIDYPFAADESYVAMLHHETNDNDTYDFGEGNTDVDVPVMRDGAPVVMTFQPQGM